MMAEGMPVTQSAVGLYGSTSVYKAKLISYFEKILDFLTLEDFGDETVKENETLRKEKKRLEKALNKKELNILKNL